ncbi:hypothetical protein [Aeoliella sp.]|uniref:hypothetical protein n=1 Tax=Aeoliella sp. TaxID=2795800 RepID=UPI003CCB8AD8
MKLYGGDLIASVVAEDNRLVKLVINEAAAYLFPADIQHQDATQPGLCYRDDSAGNALAATIKSGRIEIRHHDAYSDERVRSIMRQLMSLPEFKTDDERPEVFYQGRELW